MAEGFEESRPEEVKTGADKLLELARASKEVAIAEAAKKLGVSQATVEAWANFLEEDGLIAVKYKFTTPFITIPEAAGAKKHKQDIAPVEGLEFNELRGYLDGMNDSILKAEGETKAGEFGMLKQTHASLLAKIRSTHDALIEKAEVSPQRKAQLNEMIATAESYLEAASSQAAEGRFDQASISYSELYRQAKAAISELNKLYEQMVTLHAMEETKDYKDLIGKAYELMNEGKIEEANELYNRLTFARKNLAQEFNDKKRQMEDDLVKLNKDLSQSADQANLQKLAKAKQKIAALLNAGNKFLRKGEFDTAESYYLAIRHEYDTLPKGFSEEKKELQQGILGFYSALAHQHEKKTKKKFDTTARQIENLLKQTNEMLKEAKIDEAIRLYKEIRASYKAMPGGFLKEKAELQEKILPLHTAITSQYAKESLDTLKQESAEILGLLAKMSAHTERGELAEAEQAYQRTIQLYKAMPKGFLHEETTLQSQIVEAYEKYLTKAKTTESTQATDTLSKIEAMTEKAEASLKAKDYAAANDAYLKTVSLYSSLPAGLVAQKKQAREKMLQLYKSLLTLSSEHGWKANGKKADAPMKLPEIREAPVVQNAEIHERELQTRQDIEEPKQEHKSEDSSEETTHEAKAEEEIRGETESQIETQFSEQRDAQSGETRFATEEEDIRKMDDEIEDIEEKIEQLKTTSKATVKYPYSSGA